MECSTVECQAILLGLQIANLVLSTVIAKTARKTFLNTAKKRKNKNAV